MTTAIFLAGTMMLCVCLFVWACNLKLDKMALEQKIKTLKAQNVEYGLLCSRAMTFYIVQARYNRKLIKKYNRLNAVFCKHCLDGFSPIDRASLLTSEGLEKDFELENPNKIASDVINDNIKNFRDQEKHLKLDEKENKT